MTGMAASGPMSPQPQDTGAITDDGDHIAPAGVLKGKVRVFLDLAARLGNARRIGKGKVMAIFKGRLAAHFQLSMEFLVKRQGFGIDFFRICHKGFLLFQEA